MTTSPSTFESELRERLVNVIYTHWSKLGAAFAGADLDRAEVIDPEALLWASLEFLATEPRLVEAVVSWLHANKGRTIRQRFKSRLDYHEPRTAIWLAVASTREERLPRYAELPSQPCYGMESPAAVIEFSHQLGHRARSYERSELKRVGSLVAGPATILLRLRDILGSDARHFLLLYLLCNPQGAPLEPVQEWTGYSSRTISDTVSRWVDAGIVSHKYGICRLLKPSAWEAILEGSYKQLSLVNWFGAFEASIQLLRALAKGRLVGLSDDSSVIFSHRKEAHRAILSSGLNECGLRSPSIRHLLSLFPPG